MRTYREHQAFYDKLQRDVAKAAGKASASIPTARSRSVAGSGRLTAIADEVQAGGDPDLGLPGQPDVDGRRSQRRLHRAGAEGLEPRRFKGNYGEFHARSPRAAAGEPVANLFTLGSAGTFLAQTPFTP